jgi:hypothetical protein
MYDFGQLASATFFLAHTGGALSPAVFASAANPHRRFFSRPDFRHASHSQPAWLDA